MNESSVSELKLEVQPRLAEKNASRKLQTQGRVPAIVYGSKIKNLCFSLKENDAKKYSQTVFENKIFTLLSRDKKIDGLKVLKKNVAYHPVTRSPIHIDFLALDMSQKIRVTVEIKFTGKAKGVKEQGGVFNSLRRNVEVECLVNDIPSRFELDVSELKMGESRHVSDLSIPKNIRLMTRLEETLCLVSKAQEEVVQKAADDEGKPAVEGEAPTADSEEKTASSAESSGDSPDDKNKKAKQDKKS